MRNKTLAFALIALFVVICVSAFAEEPKPALELHGYMQNRAYNGGGSNTEFKSERISIQASEALPDDAKAYIEVYYQPYAKPDKGGDTYLESAYYDRPVGDGHIRVGKGRLLNFGITPAYPNRRTSNYGLISEAFTQDRVSGVQYYIKKGHLDAGMTLFQAYQLATREVGDITGDYVREGIAANTAEHLALRDPLGSFLSNNVWAAARLGGVWGDLKAGVSDMSGTLDSRDVVNLSGAPAATNPLTPATIFNGTTFAPKLFTTAPSKRIGLLSLDGTYKTKNSFVLQAQTYGGKISDIKVNSYALLAGYEPANGWKYYVRYGKEDIGGVVKTTNPLTWGMRQTSISVVQPVNKTVWMQYEYEINGETPVAGAKTVSNNLFFAELFTGF